MRVICTYGSGRGAAGNRRPYRDSRRAGRFVGVRTQVRVETKCKATDPASSHLWESWHAA